MQTETPTTETKSKHTPGPWRLERRPAYGAAGRAPVPKRIVSDRGTVCSFNEGVNAAVTEEREANAALFMAAPELLDHARLFARCIEHEIEKSRRAGDDEGANLKGLTLHLVRQTIAKAEGR